FLASEVMLFGALFSAYILLRVGADPKTWPTGLLNIPIGTFNTTVLITSSVTVVLSWSSLKVGNFAAHRKYQAVTILCALGFLGIKSVEYRDKWTHYEIWKTDGSRMTGHIEGKPYFWRTETLAKKKLDSIKFIPDPDHYTTPRAVRKTSHHGEGEEKAIEVKTSEIKRLSAFVPGHSTYFAIYFTL